MTKLRFTLLASVLLAVLLASMTFGVMVGSVDITPSIIWEVLFTKMGLSAEVAASKAQSIIIWEIRLPRIILAAIVGAALAISGAAIQALVRNPIADPYILGVSSGASVGATLVILLGAFSFLGTYALSVAAFFGAILAVVIVFLLARVNGRTSVIRLLLAGIAISMVFSAITNFMLMTSKQQGGIQAVIHWTLGSLAGAKWSTIGLPFFTFLLIFILLLFNYRQLNALLLGEELATTLGINLDRFRIFIILAVSLLTGVVVASSGSIGFVGLIVPHVVRMMVGSNYKLVLPISALMGAVFLVWADMAARVAIAPEEMPIGIVTAVCGGPFFIWMLRRRRYSFGDGE
ncbi:ABC transporter permease [Sporosarcina sp. P37]|uniref:FecCD family ABC transporter permease n=1 Tax=unclassified Sporosarcina TaxID=2647733 RepID=UPI000A17AC65|nr:MULTISPECIES: iron ABC transporter permease [unclassified Sporosarcina]ARK24623.1 ABC transporter permease [Sporosarcina sp. P37]PID19780.1 iron ABC transporter permease [Sporosarcina sp. P35]